jgi:hypothetical protein
MCVSKETSERTGREGRRTKNEGSVRFFKPGEVPEVAPLSKLVADVAGRARGQYDG